MRINYLFKATTKWFLPKKKQYRQNVMKKYSLENKIMNFLKNFHRPKMEGTSKINRPNLPLECSQEFHRTIQWQFTTCLQKNASPQWKDIWLSWLHERMYCGDPFGWVSLCVPLTHQQQLISNKIPFFNWDANTHSSSSSLNEYVTISLLVSL